MTYDGMIFNVVINNSLITTDRKRGQRGSNNTKQELDFRGPSSKYRSDLRCSFSMRSHPRFHGLPRSILVRTKHLFWDGHLKHRIQPIFSIQVWAQSPHLNLNCDWIKNRFLQMEIGFLQAMGLWEIYEMWDWSSKGWRMKGRVQWATTNVQFFVNVVIARTSYFWLSHSPRRQILIVYSDSFWD